MTNRSAISTDDCEIQSALLQQLEGMADLDVADVGVTVRHGAVTLSGVLDTIAQRRAVVQAASGVRGVTGVSNELLIFLSSSGARHDRATTAVVARALQDALGESDSATIVSAAENGTVVLTGTVTSATQHTVAVNVVERLRDVRVIDDRISSESAAAVTVGEPGPRVRPLSAAGSRAACS